MLTATSPTILPIPTAAALAERFERDGFTEGLPSHLTTEIVHSDRACAARMQCPGCGRRKMAFRPHHRGQRWRVLLACSTCGGGAEY